MKKSFLNTGELAIPQYRCPLSLIPYGESGYCEGIASLDKSHKKQ